jgi:predicted PurR-regulated permease PerM
VKFGQWLGLMVLIASLYIIWQTRQLLLMAFAAIVLATALHQLAKFLRKQFKISHQWSLAGSLSVFLLSVVSFFWLVVPSLVKQMQVISSKVPKVLELAQNSKGTIEQYLPGIAVPDFPTLQEQAKPLLNSLVGSSFAVFTGSLGAALNLLLLLVLTIMLLVQPHAYRDVFVLLFPHFYRRRVIGILDDCEVALGKWMVGALLGMLAVGVMTTIGLSVLQVPAPLAQGVLAGLLNFIPNLGPTLSMVLPMGIGLLDSPWKSLWVFILYFVVQQIESSFLTPYIMSKQVSLLPALTLLAQVFFASFFGFAGLVLALPLSVVSKIWINAVLIEDVLSKWRRQPSQIKLTEEPLILDPWDPEAELLNMILVPTPDLSGASAAIQHPSSPDTPPAPEDHSAL